MECAAGLTRTPGFPRDAVLMAPGVVGVLTGEMTHSRLAVLESNGVSCQPSPPLIRLLRYGTARPRVYTSLLTLPLPQRAEVTTGVEEPLMKRLKTGLGALRRTAWGGYLILASCDAMLDVGATDVVHAVALPDGTYELYDLPGGDLFDRESATVGGGTVMLGDIPVLIQVTTTEIRGIDGRNLITNAFPTVSLLHGTQDEPESHVCASSPGILVNIGYVVAAGSCSHRHTRHRQWRRCRGPTRIWSGRVLACLSRSHGTPCLCPLGYARLPCGWHVFVLERLHGA